MTKHPFLVWIRSRTSASLIKWLWLGCVSDGTLFSQHSDTLGGEDAYFQSLGYSEEPGSWVKDQKLQFLTTRLVGGQDSGPQEELRLCMLDGYGIRICPVASAKVIEWIVEDKSMNGSSEKALLDANQLSLSVSATNHIGYGANFLVYSIWFGELSRNHWAKWLSARRCGTRRAYCHSAWGLLHYSYTFRPKTSRILELSSRFWRMTIDFRRRSEIAASQM